MMNDLRRWLNVVQILNERTPDSPAFRRWFAGSKVVKKNGEPLMMFHGTNQTFQEFHSGSHFGTSRAANHRLKFLQGWMKRLGDKPPENQHIIPVYLSIKNPLRVSDRDASDEAELLNSIIRGNYPTANIDIAVARRDGAYVAAEQAGYDGLVYRNNIEDRGRYSWVVFRPEQVRAALTGMDEAVNDSRDRVCFGFDVDEPVYHGTTAGEFPVFKTHYRPGEQLGFGIHVTPDRAFAERYATDPSTTRRGKHPHVFVGYLRKGRVLDADTIVKQGSPEFDLARKLAGRRLMTQKDENGIPSVYMQNAIDSTSGKRAESLIRAAGYDTIRYNASIRRNAVGGFYKEHDAVTYVVLNPAALRRENARFDADQIESDDLLA